jgi:hypothetical protein
MSAPRFGVGFRTRHFDEIVAGPPAVDWFEVVADDYIGVGGPRRAMLERLRAERPVALHGVSLSIAGSSAAPRGLGARPAGVGRPHRARWVSDHLCWTALGGADRTTSCRSRTPARCWRTSSNASIAFRHCSGGASSSRTRPRTSRSRADELDEADFVAALCRRTGCGLLVDVNNLVVNAANLASIPSATLAAIPPDAVGYLHLAGHAVLPDVPHRHARRRRAGGRVGALRVGGPALPRGRRDHRARRRTCRAFAALAAEAADARAPPRGGACVARPRRAVRTLARRSRSTEPSEARSTHGAPSWVDLQADF